MKLIMKFVQNAMLVAVLLVFVPLSFGFEPKRVNLTLDDIARLNDETGPDKNKHEAQLDLHGKYLIKWNYDNDSITFDIDVQTAGWAGLGFSPTGSMIGADIVIIWIDDQGEGHISDRHAPENGYPLEDMHQDYFLDSARRDKGRMKATFHRLRNTCDTEDNVLTTGTTKIIYAFNDLMPTADGHIDKHPSTNRDIKGIFLFDTMEPGAHLPNDTFALDMTSRNLIWPNGLDTRYWCQLYEMPKYSVHYMLRAEAMIQPGSEPYVHHISLYQCSKNMSAYLNKAEPCFTGDGTSEDYVSPLNECSDRLIFFWNKGMAPLNMPSSVGMPMFESDEDCYVVLEVHYDNHEFKTDRTDKSGLRLYLSPTKRQIDAGMMLLGTPENALRQIIPPGDEEFHFYGHYDECLQSLPSTGTNFAYGYLHAHLYGRQIRVMHVRNGIQLPHILEDNSHDFNYEQYRRINPLRTVLPGDNIIVDCVYNTKSTNKTMFGGFSTHRNEMCGATFLYYPRHAGSFVCLNFPDPSAYVPIFGGHYIDPQYPKNFDNATVNYNGENQTIYEFIKKIDWEKPGLRGQYKELTKSGKHLLDFHRALINGTSRPQPRSDILTHIGFPNITTPYVPPIDTSCQMTSTTIPSSASMSIQRNGVLIFSFSVTLYMFVVFLP